MLSEIFEKPGMRHEKFIQLCLDLFHFVLKFKANILLDRNIEMVTSLLGLIKYQIMH